jgi:hypothetical protein
MAKQEIFEAMAKVMEEVEAIGKEKTNQSQGFKYRGIDQVYNDLHPLLAKHKIFTTPKVIEQQREERVNKNGTVLFYSRVTMQYTFWTVDGTSVDCSAIGEGMDSGDKATNKAMAIAHKYALLQTFCIPTEDMPDPDSQVHEVKPKQQPTGETLNGYLDSKGMSKEAKTGFIQAHNITAGLAKDLLADKAALNQMIQDFLNPKL